MYSAKAGERQELDRQMLEEPGTFIEDKQQGVHSKLILIKVTFRRTVVAELSGSSGSASLGATRMKIILLKSLFAVERSVQRLNNICVVETTFCCGTSVLKSFLFV